MRQCGVKAPYEYLDEFLTFIFKKPAALNSVQYAFCRFNSRKRATNFHASELFSPGRGLVHLY
jgi:hypothetical protein